MNIIRSIRTNTHDGVVDIVYITTTNEVRRLASFENPTPDFIEALKEVALEAQKMLGTPALSLSAISFKHELTEGSFRMSFLVDARGWRCKLSVPSCEYLIDEHGEIKPTGNLPSRLIYLAIDVEEAAKRYLDGDRAQKTFQFEEPAAVGS